MIFNNFDCKMWMFTETFSWNHHERGMQLFKVSLFLWRYSGRLHCCSRQSFAYPTYTLSIWCSAALVFIYLSILFYYYSYHSSLFAPHFHSRIQSPTWSSRFRSKTVIWPVTVSDVGTDGHLIDWMEEINLLVRTRLNAFICLKLRVFYMYTEMSVFTLYACIV